MSYALRSIREKFRSLLDKLGQLPTKRVDIALAIVVTLVAISTYSYLVTGGVKAQTLFSVIGNTNREVSTRGSDYAEQGLMTIGS